MPMATLILGNGKMTRLMDMVFTFIWTEPLILEIGRMINRMVMGSKLGQMDQNMKEITRMEKSKAKENSYGQTHLLMRGTLWITI